MRLDSGILENYTYILNGWFQEGINGLFSFRHKDTFKKSKNWGWIYLGLVWHTLACPTSSKTEEGHFEVSDELKYVENSLECEINTFQCMSFPIAFIQSNSRILLFIIYSNETAR